ncbi:hypothetical protein QBC43DRAFT_200727 [Cladorrhinum sp. PSN259]|nr:hypothetical protein QBC43DRAFT_200727 [Cladorrhinum sp. PSN259]
MLQGFRNGRGDSEPWNPLKATVGGANVDLLGGQQLNVGIFNTPPNYQSFGTYRSVATHSEVDTISPSIPRVPSDSGYGGSSTLYNVDPDHSAETRSLILQYDQHRLNLGSISGYPSEGRPRKRAPRSNRGGSTSTNLVIKCRECDFSAKTKSELKKHIARHDKPFKCDFPNCPKAKEGFSTKNDLDRHKLCVHKVHMPDRTLYRCHIHSCRDKTKDWPRQDNFRQHLKRVHRIHEIADLSPFIYRPLTLFHSPPIPEDVRSNAMSESTPSEPGMSNADVHLQWAGMSAGPSGPGSSSDATAGAPRMIQPANSHHFSSHSQGMDESDYQALAEAVGFQTQSQSSLDNSRIEMELAGLMQTRYGQEDESIPHETSMDTQTCIAPNILSHTGTGMDLFSLEDRSDIRIHPPSIIIHLDDTPSITHEDDLAQRHKTEVETPVSRDEMSLDEPIQYQDMEDDYKSEAADPEDTTLTRMDETEVSMHQSVYSEDSSSLKTRLASSSSSELDRNSPESIDLDDTEANALAALRVLQGNPASIDKILERIGYLKRFEDTETKGPQETKDIKDLSHLKDAKLDIPGAKTTATSSVAGESVKIFPCNACDKTFTRPCELKKHQRRHEKPYACTFARCDKRFGSKNDWKRHENSQHSQFEIWRCVEHISCASASSLTECGKVYQRRESLKAHLEKDHEISDLEAIEKKLNDFRHGRNFESRFWCGFCVKTIEPEQGHGGPAHSERFDHIDHHFMGKKGYPKADISSWVGLDAEVVEAKGKGKEFIEILDDKEPCEVNGKKRGLEDHEGGSKKNKKAKKTAEKAAERTEVDQMWSCVGFPAFL